MNGVKRLLALLIITLIRMTFTDKITKEEGVLVLTDKNFDQVLKENIFVLVHFYTPYSSNCKKLVREYVKAAKILAKDKQPIFLAKADATSQRGLVSRFEINSYPTLKFFISGNPVAVAFKGGRNANDIIVWLRSMRKATGDYLTEFNSSNEVNAFIQNNEVGIVFFGADFNLFSIFELMAKKFEDLEFAFCMSDDCLSHFSAKHGQVTIFKKFDERRNNLAESFNYLTIFDFIRNNSTPKAKGKRDEL